MSSRPPVPRGADRLPQSGGFETLRELTRHGYVPDAQADEAGGILLRHDAGPDLVLKADGTLELPSAQPLKRTATPPRAPRRQLSWGRTALFIIFAVAFWILSLVVTINLTAD